MDRARAALLRSAIPLACLALLALPRAARADLYTADFSSPDQWDPASGGGAIWNPFDRRVQAAWAANARDIDFGDGRDGVFDDGPSQAGVVVSASGNEILVDTDAKDLFRFRSFKLGAGKTLKATGSKPLTILVLGDAEIQGTLDLNGYPGAANAATGPVLGGAPGAGGGKGGDAGYGAAVADHPAGIGAPIAGGATSGGTGGANNDQNLSDDNGGAGGCNGIGGGGTDAQAGTGNTPAAVTCSATARTAIATAFDSVLRGGAGGGGGGGYTVANANQVTGGAGGGGGGALRLSVLGTLTLSGALQANGAAGGATPNAPDPNHCGGSGGGGSGGAIWAQARLISGGGTAAVAAGAAGNAGSCAGISDGGDGSTGVIRVDSGGGTIGAIATTPLAVRSGVDYSLASKPIPLGYNYAALGTPTETFDTVSADCVSARPQTVTYEGSNDGVVFEHEVDRSRVAELNDYRYVRFKVTIGTAPVGTATQGCLTGLSIPYGPRELTDLSLSGGMFCGSWAGPGKTTGRGGRTARGAVGDLLVIALAMAFARLATRRRASAAAAQ